MSMDDGTTTVARREAAMPRLQSDAGHFDEAAYLKVNPDVAFAIARGDVGSGYLHYLQHGLREGRSVPVSADEPRNHMIPIAPTGMADAQNREIAQFFEAVYMSRDGGVLIVGWIDDSTDPLDYVRLSGYGWRLTVSGDSLGRVRRVDVEQTRGSGMMHPYGYYGFVFGGEPVSAGGPCKVEIALKSGRKTTTACSVWMMGNVELRDQVLSHIHGSHHFGSAHIKAIEGFDRGAGAEILKLNRHITQALVAHPYVERFGRQDARYDGSIIVCLYGKAEFMFLQAALYSRMRGIGRYEFIYVSNSPELSETLLREARAAVLIYGIDISVVLLPGNAGFGAANNAAARFARSDRIMIVNPDVFPMDDGFADRHTDLLNSLPSEQSRLFGAALYYDDSSLMHGGMFFELDSAVSLEQGRHKVCELVRVEHYGKGAPPGLTTFTRPRPVPAVTGAFMSCERPWFEKLGGFTEEYVFGHYEDADLCLKSLQEGVPVWIQDLKLWHLEGCGSTRRPVHEGGSLVNRWLFSSTWGENLSPQLLGPNPTHPAFKAGPKRGRWTGQPSKLEAPSSSTERSSQL
jgi:GT2 family glycosyltransferase